MGLWHVLVLIASKGFGASNVSRRQLTETKDFRSVDDCATRWTAFAWQDPDGCAFRKTCGTPTTRDLCDSSQLPDSQLPVLSPGKTPRTDRHQHDMSCIRTRVMVGDHQWRDGGNMWWSCAVMRLSRGKSMGPAHHAEVAEFGGSRRVASSTKLGAAVGAIQSQRSKLVHPRRPSRRVDTRTLCL